MPFARAAQPFSPESSGYFDIARSCAKLTVRAGDAELAESFIRSQKVRLLGIDTGHYIFWNDSVPRIHAAYEDGHQAGRISAELTSTELTSASCSVQGCYGKNTGSFYRSMDHCCEHVLAALRLAQARLGQRPIGYGTDRTGEYLMSYFTAQPLPGAEAVRQPCVRLEPRLVHDAAGPQMYVDFRCGTDRLYAVKTPARLFDAEQRREAYEAGPLKLDFARDTFSPESAALADWAGKAATTQASILRSVSHSSNVPLKKASISRLLLSGDQLDSFFDWGLGRTIALLGGDQRKVTLGEAAPRISLDIVPVRDQSGFTGVRVQGTLPAVQFSERYIYHLDGGSWLRADIGPYQTIRRVIEAADSGRQLSFTIGRSDLAAFCRHVLPALRQCAEVTEHDAEQIIAYIPPEPAFAFYLDWQDGTVLMAAKALYDGTEFPLYDGSMAGRDADAEARVAEQLASLFDQWDPVRHEYALKPDEGRLYRFLTEGTDRLSALGAVHVTDRFAALRVRRHWSITAGVRLESGLLELRLLSSGLDQDELRELLDTYAARRRYHRLKDGSFIALEQDGVDQLDALFEAAHVPLREFVSGKMHLPQYRALYLDRVLEEHSAIVSERSRHFRDLIKSFKTITDADYEAPGELRKVLRPYQQNGFRWLMTLYNCGFGGILADDMGLGKTLQMIALFEQIRQTKPHALQLVICPASLVYNWIDELHRFAPGLRALAIAGARAERSALIAGASAQDVLVTSYDLFKRDVAGYEKLDIDITVLDEAQFIKNQSSAAARSVKTLRCTHRFALTGTPVENRLSELWSIFDFLMPGFLYGYDTFRREFEAPIVRNEDTQARERLQRMIAPFVLRRLKKDVLRDLPDKHEEQRRVALDGKQRRLYDAQVLRLKQLLDKTTDEDLRHSKLQVLAELTRLRQICCDPALLYEGYDEGSAKREALTDLLRTAVAGGHKVLVFSQFTSLFSLLEAGFRAEGFSYMVLTGETDKKERLRMANAFNGDATDIFLISLKAGGTGLNLTGADIVIHYDPWWNYAVEQQATDRAHRIGQTKAVTVYKLVAKDTVEERIIALQESKRGLAEGILSGDSVSLSGMNREDLLELIGA